MNIEYNSYFRMERLQYFKEGKINSARMCLAEGWKC